MNELKIGYDAKRAFCNNTGLGNYSRFVIEGVARENPQDTLLLYTPKTIGNPRIEPILALPNVEPRFPAGPGFKGSLWRTFGIPNHLRADKVDLYHGLSNELPLTIREAGVPSVLTMHDVIYRRLPGGYSLFDRVADDIKYGKSCRNATHIIAVSECTKRDVVELYGVSPDNVTVVYQGCDEIFRKEPAEKALEDVGKRYRLPDHYVLQVGTVEKRKNLEQTIRALKMLPTGVSLVVVGRDNKGYKKYCQKLASETGVSERVIWLEGVPFADLPLIYRRAEVVAYPSRYEGFGIPVLEGLASGRPVVAATGSCLEEAGGDAAIYVNPDSADELASALLSIIRSETDVEGMIRRGLAHADRFRLSDMASEVMKVYKKVLS